METILVTGGAGYIGSVLVYKLLRKNYKVRVVDKLMYGGEPLIPFFDNPNFELIVTDINDEKEMKKAVKGVSSICHLAAIVGDPACAKQPDLAKRTNLDDAISLYEIARENDVERFIFSSTCSNYGKMKTPNEYITEESELSPVSLYAETKVAFEKYLLNQAKVIKCIPVLLRFATVYGISPRMRFDLTVNEFTKELALGRELVIYGEQFWRPYCHVYDLTESVVISLMADKKKIAFEVFNVGDTSENYTKQMLAEEMAKIISGTKVKYVRKNEDPRDYRVNFDKITKTLDFHVSKRVPDGIKEIKRMITDGVIKNPDDEKYFNVC